MTRDAGLYLMAAGAMPLVLYTARECWINLRARKAIRIALRERADEIRAIRTEVVFASYDSIPAAIRAAFTTKNYGVSLPDADREVRKMIFTVEFHLLSCAVRDVREGMR